MNRRERRLANKGIPQVKIKTEVYRLIGKHGQTVMLDVAAMRQWGEHHAESVRVPIDPKYVDRLFARGAVSEERVVAVLKAQKFKPVLLCTDINPEGDEIVDGNHTYVAIAWAWAALAADGKAPEGILPSAPGLLFQPADWGRFVIPASLLL